MGEDKRPLEASTNGWEGLRVGDDGEWSQWRRWATGVVFASKLNIDRGRARKMPVSHEEISFRQDGKTQRVHVNETRRVTRSSQRMHPIMSRSAI